MDKQAALESVGTTYKELLSSFEGLDEKAMSTVFYGTWSVKDILAHIIGWQREMTGALERMARGERPTPEGVDYGDADAWNAKFASRLSQQSSGTVIAALEQSHATYVRAANAIAEDRFGEGKTVNRLLEASGYGHYREHAPDIAAFKASRA